MKLFKDNAPFYKANFHTHTTESDGRLTPAESMARYRAMGYDILALTDHRRVTVPENVPEGLLTVPGIEIDYMLETQAVHLLGLGIAPAFGDTFRACVTPQQGVDGIRAAGGLAILAHPAWSLNNPAFMAGLENVTGVEVWNSVSAPPMNADRADSSSLLDVTATLGRCWPFFANDDTHAYGPELGAGFTMVQADELTVPAVLSALEAGRFYASQGPAIHQITLENGVMTVDCSPAERVIFYSNLPWASSRVIISDGITHAEYKAAGNETYLRCEITDASGKRAWSGQFRL